MATESSSITVHDLRRRWRPHKESLLAERNDHSTPIRFHRACSWLSRVEKLEDPADYDLSLISLWIVFNALFGQWNESAREPVHDREPWSRHLRRIVKLDSEGRIRDILTRHKKLIIALYYDEYLEVLRSGLILASSQGRMVSACERCRDRRSRVLALITRLRRSQWFRGGRPAFSEET